MAERPLVDVAMIVKDEEANIEACLAALAPLRPHLGGVYIYDTGSSDATVRLARAAGATVQEGYWDDDFARARNEAIAMGDATWAMIVDADDRFVGDADALVHELRTQPAPTTTAFLATVLMGEGPGALEGQGIRFLDRRRTRYRNKIHERVVANDGSAPLCGIIPTEAMRLIHVGYTPGLHEQKMERNLRMLEIEVETARRRHARTHLAEALYNRGRTFAGLGRFEEAIADLREMRSLKKLPQFRLDAGERLAKLLLDLERWDEATELLLEMRSEDGDPDMSAWLWARLSLGLGRPEEALPLLRLVQDPVTATRLHDGWAPVLLARVQAAALVGEYDEALAAAIPLLAKHGAGAGLGELIVAMWGRRPPATLAALFAEFGPTHAEGVAAELRSAGDRGALIAAAYLRAVGLPAAAEDPAISPPALLNKA